MKNIIHTCRGFADIIRYPKQTPEGDWLYRGRFYESYPCEEVERDERLADLEADRRLHIRMEAEDILQEIEDNGD